MHFAALLRAFEMPEVETLTWRATSAREAKPGDELFCDPGLSWHPVLLGFSEELLIAAASGTTKSTTYFRDG
jgi:hypothetical protein